MEGMIEERISPRSREAGELFLNGGLTRKEVAAKMGISYGTACNYIKWYMNLFRDKIHNAPTKKQFEIRSALEAAFEELFGQDYKE